MKYVLMIKGTTSVPGSQAELTLRRSMRGRRPKVGDVVELDELDGRFKVTSVVTRGVYSYRKHKVEKDTAIVYADAGPFESYPAMLEWGIISLGSQAITQDELINEAGEEF